MSTHPQKPPAASTQAAGAMKLTGRQILSEILVLTEGVGIIAAAIYFFLVPSQTSVSSVSGLAIVLANFVPLSISMLTLIINGILLLLGFFTCGKTFGIKTVYTSIMLPVLMAFLEWLVPNFQSLTGSPELDVICFVLIVDSGLCILLNRNASSGGIDIVAKVMNKYLHMDLGKAMALSGMCVALSSAFVYDAKTVVLSVLGTYLNGKVLDSFIFGQNLKRKVCIITKREPEVLDFLLGQLDSGATIYIATGAYTGQTFREIEAIVDKSKYQRLMNYMARTDPDAFVTVYSVSDMRCHPKLL